MALIYRQAALDKFKPWLEVKGYSEGELNMLRAVIYELENLPDAGQEIIHCKDCKHNPKKAWFGCPMAHLNERQRPEDAWCWKGERETE